MSTDHANDDTGHASTGARPTAPLRPFRTPVRGHAFAAPPPGAPSPLEQQAALLVREPHNPADPQAVAIWVAAGDTRWRIGYLDRAVAARIAPRMDAGWRFAGRVEGEVAEPDGRWRRPLVRVEPIAAGASGPTPKTSSGRAGLWGRPPASRRRVVSPQGRKTA